MKRQKPSWVMTNVTWETKKLIWKFWACGETVSETARYFELHPDDHAVYSRDTIGKVRDELEKLPVSQLKLLIEELPEIIDLVEELRPDHAEQQVQESEQLSRHFNELSSAASLIASNLEKYRNEPGAFLGTPIDRVYDLVYGIGIWLGEGRAKLDLVDKTIALELLAHLQYEKEFPELANITDWAELSDDRITGDLIQRLFRKAHRGNFKGTCPVCKDF